MPLADDISMAERHVAQGNLHLTRQHELIAKLNADCHPTEDAVAFLHLLEDLQELHRAHLARLLRKATCQ